jgi:hypothetical protein
VTAWLGFRLFGGPLPGGFARSTMWRLAWLYFLVLTIVFGPSLEPVLDPRFIGHQAREILTHTVTSLPLGLACLGIVQRVLRLRVRAGSWGPRWRAAGLIGVFAIPAYLGIAALTTDAMAAGQTEFGLAAVVAAHFFEHSLDFVLLGCLVVGLEGARLQVERLVR